MKTNKKRRKKIIYILLPLAVIIVLLAVCIYFYTRTANTNTPTNTQTPAIPQTIDYAPSTTEQKQAVETKKISNQTPVSTKFTATISKNTSNNIIQIRSVINGATSNNGTCDLTITKGAETVSKSAATYALPSSSTCQGFDINRSELSAGTWQINMTVTINGERATADDEIKLE
jgi:hypothetical protein